MCIVAGAVSGNLECIDFDHGAELYDAWAGRIAPALLSRLVVERTQSGGKHVLYRCESPVCGNLKLARGIRDGKETTLIETRGEGGLFLCAPTDGYCLEQNSFETIPTLKTAERNTLIEAARALDEVAATPVSVSSTGPSTFSLRPGDDFCARGDLRPFLEYHGWKRLGSDKDGNERWQRPGKAGTGTSATFNGEVFYVFSSNAVPFESNHGYNAFQAFALLEHAGDFSAAAADLLEQGYGSEDEAGVDLTALCAPREATLAAPAAETAQVPDAPAEAPQEADPGPVPAELLKAPGLVSDLAAYTMATTVYPNPVIAHCAAIALVSALSARVFRDKRNTRPNLYVVALAESGAGKEHPRQVNYKLLNLIGGTDLAAGTFASGEAIEDALVESPSLFFQTDEFGKLIEAFRNKDDRMLKMSEMLLTLATASGGSHITRARARSRQNPTGGRAVVQNPCVTILGTSTPRHFYSALTPDLYEDGLVGRCMLVDASDRSEGREPLDIPIPTPVVDAASHLLSLLRERASASAETPQTITVPEAPDATALIERGRKEADAFWREAKGADNDGAMALWARAHERACKLALIYAISEHPDAPRITAEGFEWGRALS